MTTQFDLDNMDFHLQVTEDKLNQLGGLFSVIAETCNNKEMMPIAVLMESQN